MQSVIQDKKECYFCPATQELEDHHIFGSKGNRKLSEKYGLKVWLCKEHHDEVHEGGKKMDELHKVGQRKFEEKHTREQYRKTFLIRSYL